MMKKLNSILLWVGVAFLIYLIGVIGPVELCRELGSLGLGLIPFVFAEGAAEMIHTLGWRYCLSEPHRSLSWWFLFRVRMSGYAINYLTPTASMGGEVTRIALLASRGRGPQAVSGVLIEKACFALAQILFVAGGSFFIVSQASLPRALWIGMLFGSALVLGGVIAFMLLQKHANLGALIRWLGSRNDRSDALRVAAASVTSVDESLRSFYQDRPFDLCRAIALHLIGFLCGVFQTWLFFAILFQKGSWNIAAAACTLAMWFDLLTFVVPLNAGTLEGSRVLTIRAVGFSSVAGLTYGVAVRLSQLLWSVIGLLLYGSLALPAHRALVPGSSSEGDGHPHQRPFDEEDREIRLAKEPAAIASYECKTG